MSENLPDWLTVGAKVATLTSNHRMHRERPKFATVARIGKRDIVLDDDQRFSIRYRERREGGTWGWSVRLMPADDPVVQEALEMWRYDQLVTRAKTACENYRFGKDGTSVVDVILACAPLTGVADEIWALFDEATHPTSPSAQCRGEGRGGAVSEGEG